MWSPTPHSALPHKSIHAYRRRTANQINSKPSSNVRAAEQRAVGAHWGGHAGPERQGPHGGRFQGRRRQPGDGAWGRAHSRGEGALDAGCWLRRPNGRWWRRRWLLLRLGLVGLVRVWGLRYGRHAGVLRFLEFTDPTQHSISNTHSGGGKEEEPNVGGGGGGGGRGNEGVSLAAIERWREEDQGPGKEGSFSRSKAAKTLKPTESHDPEWTPR